MACFLISNKLWAITGIWVIDLFVGRETSQPNNIEIIVFHVHQLDLKEHMAEATSDLLHYFNF